MVLTLKILISFLTNFLKFVIIKNVLGTLYRYNFPLPNKGAVGTARVSGSRQNKLSLSKQRKSLLAASSFAFKAKECLCKAPLKMES